MSHFCDHLRMESDQKPRGTIGQRYIAALEAKNVDWLCPICRKREWKPLLDPRVMPSVNSMGESIEGPTAGAVECLFCGSVQFFNPWGVID
jgi:hypothetical protein